MARTLVQRMHVGCTLVITYDLTNLWSNNATILKACEGEGTQCSVADIQLLPLDLNEEKLAAAAPLVLLTKLRN